MKAKITKHSASLLSLVLIYLVCFFPVSARAQYTGYFEFADIRKALVHNIIFKDAIEKDAVILKENRVKEVKVMDEYGKLNFKMSFNKQGWVTDYSAFEYNGEEINYKIDWDEDGRISRMFYSDNGMNWVYTPFYKNDMLDYIELDFNNGMIEDYIFNYKTIGGKTVFSSLEYKEKGKDTADLLCILNYDESGRLTSIRDNTWFSLLNSIDYGDSSVIVKATYEETRKYTLEDNRITSEEIVVKKENMSRAYMPHKFTPYIKTNKKYFYRWNGLIDYIETNHNFFKSKTNYEYSFYE